MGYKCIQVKLELSFWMPPLPLEYLGLKFGDGFSIFITFPEREKIFLDIISCELCIVSLLLNWNVLQCYYFVNDS